MSFSQWQVSSTYRRGILHKRLVVTNLTYMQGDEVCVAGIDERGRCVRPVLPSGVKRENLFQSGQLVVFPRSKLEFDATRVSITPPHVEDMRLRLSSLIHQGICGDAEW